MTKDNHLFEGFAPISKAQWHAQVIKDLKGKDFSTLRWYTDEGLVVEPYYAAEDMNSLPWQAIQQAQRKGSSGHWLNRETITFTDAKTTCQAAITALSKGADALTIDLSQAEVPAIDFARLLHGIRLTDVPVTFQTVRQSTQVLEALGKITSYQIKGSLNDDPLALWMQDGLWLPDTWPQLASLLKETQHLYGRQQAAGQARRTEPSTNFRPLTINSHHFHQAGANAAQELAFTLSSAVTYLDKLTEAGLSADEIVTAMEFSVSTGTNYLMEIAKLRALRYLFNQIQVSYGMAHPIPVFIHAQTSAYYQATLEPYTNLLRGTTEAMAAAIGGCNALTVLPFDVPAGAGSSTEFSQRIARNVSTILREEVYLDKVIDPSAGSYYLENLTYQLANQAWSIFLEIETLGGLMPAFEQGWVQAAVEKSYRQQTEQLQAGKRIMVGVNKYRNKADTESKLPFEEPISKAGKLPLLKKRRLATWVE
ncbi:MAG: methylmalonyl-CoA mutase subunit beta [Bacteroidota bacterium]